MKFIVPDMSCGHCTAAIESALSEADPSVAVQYELDTHSITVLGALSPDSIVEILKVAGYEAQPLG